MPVPRPQGVVGASQRRWGRRGQMVASPTFLHAEVVTGHTAFHALPASARAAGMSQSPNPRAENNLDRSDAVAQWLLSAQVFKRVFDMNVGKDLVVDKAPFPKPTEQGVAAHLQSLTALVQASMPSPTVVGAAGKTASPARGGKQGRTAKHLNAVGAARVAEFDTAAEQTIASLQTEMMSMTFTHLERYRERFDALTSCAVGTGPDGVNRSRFLWPWKAEVQLVTAVIASLPPARRESLETLARLLALASEAPQGLTQETATTVCVALEKALIMCGDRAGSGSCLPWVVCRLAACDAERRETISDDDRKRWLDLATQQLCSMSCFEGKNGNGKEHGGGSPQAKSSNPLFNADLPAHLRDLNALLHSEADRRAESLRSASLVTRTDLSSTVAPAEHQRVPESLLSTSVEEILSPRAKFLEQLSAALPSLPSLALLALTEMLSSAWEALTPSSPRNRFSAKSTEEAASDTFHAVGVYQAVRRFASSLGRHQLLQPLLDLSALVTGLTTTTPTATTDDPSDSWTMAATFFSSSAQWRRVLLCEQDSSVTSSALLWRELVLLDAYTLITIGHVSERALDFDRVSSSLSSTSHAHTASSDDDAPLSTLQQGTEHLRSSCVSHLHDLTSRSRCGSQSKRMIHDRITPRTRADLVARLQEALRLSTKVSLRLGDTASICRLHKQWPEMGGSWEMGKALTDAGDYSAAIDVFTRFFADTRQQYVAEVPAPIRQVALAAVEGSGKAMGRTDQPLNEGVARYFPRYRQLRTWHASLPPAVCAGALLRGLLSSHEASPLALLRMAALFLSELSKHEVSAADGLLATTVEAFVEALLSARAQPEFPRGEEEALAVLVHLMCTYPELPILRICLTRFLREDYRIGISRLLQHCFSAGPRRFTEGYMQAQFNAFPVIALEGLLEKLSAAVPLLGALPPTSGARLQTMADAGLQSQLEKSEKECVPWECLLCRTWNNRFAVTCKLCHASSTAVVQCAACDAFCSSRDGACGLCGVTFSVAPVLPHGGSPPDLGRSAKGDDGNGVCRDADSVLFSPAFKAVHALRPWQCHGCQHRNDASHAFYCAACGSAKPEMAKSLLDGAYDCPHCRQRNSMGALRPWCGSCGALSPKAEKLAATAADGGRSKTLWFCVECHRTNRWLLDHCDSCGAGKPPGPSAVRDGAGTGTHVASLAPLVEIPLAVWTCSTCVAVNHPTLTVCRACGKERSLIQAGGSDDAQTQFFLRELQAWRNREVFEEEESACSAAPGTGGQRASQAAKAASPRRCPYCRTELLKERPSTATTIFTCPNCHALQRNSVAAQLWVCLRNGCLHSNLDPEAVEPGAAATAHGCRCAGCGERRGERVSYLWKTALPHSRGMGKPTADPLGYRPPPSSSLADDPNSCVSAADSVMDALVLMPPPIGATQKCAACDSYLKVENIIGFCPVCWHCNLSSWLQCSASAPSNTRSVGFTALQLRVLFHTLHHTVQQCAKGNTVGRWNRGEEHQKQQRQEQLQLLMNFLLSSRPVLQGASATLLPWRGCDLVHGMRCGVEPRLALLASASADRNREGAATAKERSEGVDEDDNEEEEEVFHSAAVELRETIECLCELNVNAKDRSARCRQVLLLTAVELVDVMNRSTDYDEIGFPTLAKLCAAVRPDQAHHINTETRWVYLRDMKLSREWIVNDAACPLCLGTHKEGEPCTL